MSRAASVSGLVGLGCLGALAGGAGAETLPRMVAPDCPLVAEDSCHSLSSPALGVTLVPEAGGRPELVDSRRVYAGLGVDGPMVVRSGGAMVARAGRDVETTGSTGTTADK